MANLQFGDGVPEAGVGMPLGTVPLSDSSTGSGVSPTILPDPTHRFCYRAVFYCSLVEPHVSHIVLGRYCVFPPITLRAKRERPARPKARQPLLHRDVHARRDVHPLRRLRALIAARRRQRDLIRLHHRRRLRHPHELYRRNTLNQLNRGEGRHRLGRTVFHGQRGELRQRYREGQEDQLGALGPVWNALILWNTRYMDAALSHLRARGKEVKPEDVARLSPLGNKHFNVLGRYHFHVTDSILKGELRPLRSPENLTDFEDSIP